jgi:hypothetical protein
MIFMTIFHAKSSFEETHSHEETDIKYATGFCTLQPLNLTSCASYSNSIALNILQCFL